MHPTIDQYLGCNIACNDCGGHHKIVLQDLWIGDDWDEKLVDLCARQTTFGGITVVADERTYDVAGRDAVLSLKLRGLKVAECIVPDPAAGQTPVCDEKTKNAVLAQAGSPDLLVAVGSGVINDLTKWTAFEQGRPYMVVATAPSMNGYASDNIAPTIRGLKTLVRGRGPATILTGPEILAAAPAEMIAAGLGDVAAKWVSSLDWEMNAFLFGESICPRCNDLLTAAEGVFFKHSEDLAARSTVRALRIPNPDWDGDDRRRIIGPGLRGRAPNITHSGYAVRSRRSPARPARTAGRRRNYHRSRTLRIASGPGDT